MRAFNERAKHVTADWGSRQAASDCHQLLSLENSRLSLPGRTSHAVLTPRRPAPLVFEVRKLPLRPLAHVTSIRKGGLGSRRYFYHQCH